MGHRDEAHGRLVPGWSATNVNTGSCYNTGNGRFTAPVAGLYLITASTYFHRRGAAATSTPVLGQWQRQALRRTAVLCTAYAATASPLATREDTEMLEIIPLIAGDYVEFWTYWVGRSTTWPTHGRFEGYLLF